MSRVAGDIGQQHLGRADVRVGLLPADMLLTGLQRHAQGHVARASFDTPMIRPGIARLYSSRLAKKAA